MPRGVYDRSNSKKSIKKRSSPRRKPQSPFIVYRTYLKNTDPLKFLQDLALTGSTDSELRRVILDYLEAHPSN